MRRTVIAFIGAASLWKHVFAASASFGVFQRKICHVFFVWLFFFFPLTKKTKKNTNFGEIVTLKDRQPNEPTSSVIEWAFSVSSAKCEEAMINACFFCFFRNGFKTGARRGGGSKWVHMIEIAYYFLTETLVVRSVRMFRGIDCSTLTACQWHAWVMNEVAALNSEPKVIVFFSLWQPVTWLQFSIFCCVAVLHVKCEQNVY